jgi:cytochrome b6-f complex iron-sulfur subunit
MGSSTGCISRRQFCAGACQAVSSATLATVLAGCSGDSPTSPSDRAAALAVVNGRYTGSVVEVDVAGTPLSAAGGAVLVQSVAGVFLLARLDDTSYSAIDAICSHQSCTVTGADGAAYVCPCHGSRYDRNGRVLQGPATASLRRFATAVSSGVVTINL